jgi:hypothetical protein
MTMNLPATVIEAEADDLIIRWIDLVADMLTSKDGRRTLQQGFFNALHAGTLSTAHVIAAAENGVLEAHLALRQYAAEFIDQGREPELSAQVRAYVVKSLLRPIVNRGRGREVADNWRRDLGIAILVDLAAVRWNVPHTRSHHSKNPGRLSAAYLVSRALVRRHINVSERRVGNIFGDRDKIAGKLSSLIPPI